MYPNCLIINWDQTAVIICSYLRVDHGESRVQTCWDGRFKDKRQITTIFEDWHITSIPTHWCNEQITLDYINKIIIPYFWRKKADLGLSATHSALAIFNKFTGQVTEEALAVLDSNNSHAYRLYVIVPPNCTNKLQPSDVNINKPAKEYLWSKIQSWYACKITSQLWVCVFIDSIT